MSWKDFLYYSRWQQLAIISLLVLILIVLISNMLFATRKPTPIIIRQNDSLIAAFDSFYNGIEEDNKENNYTSRYIGSSSIRTQRDIQPKNGNRIDTATTRNVYKSSNKLKQGETILLNSTDTTDWKKIPGIGSAFANRIIKYRNLLGGYVAVEQLREVYGMEDDRYLDMIPYIEVDYGVKKININKLEFKELLKHPYLEYDQVKAITNLRKKKGDIKSLVELSVLSEFADEDLLRLEPYVEL